MTLSLGEQIIPVAQMGPDFLIRKKAVSSPLQRGVVALTVDGINEEIPVLLS